MCNFSSQNNENETPLFKSLVPCWLFHGKPAFEAYICKKKALAEVFSPEVADQQNTKKSANRKSANVQIFTFAEGSQINKFGKSASLRICGTFLQTAQIKALGKLTLLLQ